jgi:hypothetical protein
MPETLKAKKDFFQRRVNAKTLEALNQVYSQNEIAAKDEVYKLALHAMNRKGLWEYKPESSMSLN